MNVDITIIILSFERHDYLRRQLLVYADQPVHLIFADGSQGLWSLGTSGSMGRMKWEYFNVRGYASYPLRLVEAVARVQTPYVCLLDDQEAIFVSGIARAIEQLETHTGHSCAGGRVASAVSIGGRIRLIPYEGWSSQWSLHDDDSIYRFRALASHERTANLFYQVIRTDDLRNITAGLDTLNISYSSAIEIYLTGSLALIGKWEMGAYPYWVRSGGSLTRPAEEHPYMATRDAMDICERLLKIRETYEDVSLYSEALENDLEEVLSLTLAVWGDRRTDLRKLPGAIVASALQKSTEGLRKRLGKALRNRAPAAYRKLRKEREPDLSFSEYAVTHGSGSPVVMLEMLRIEGIWQEFPTGVTERNWELFSNVTK